MALSLLSKSLGNDLFRPFALILIASIFLGLLTDWYFLAGIPAVLLLAYLALVDFRKIFFLLAAFIPLSTEVYLSNGLGTDLPTEPLMIGLSLIYVFYFLRWRKTLDKRFFRHPITLLLLLHIGWILVATVASNLFLVSVKYFLAKLWYVVTFYFLAARILQSTADVRKLVWAVLLPLVLTVLIIMARHSGYDFSFRDINKVVFPFYRNHVNYACLMALTFPMAWLAVGWYRRWSLPWWTLCFSVVVLLGGIYFSYTRAAYVAILGAFAAYWVVRFRLMKVVLALSLAMVLGLVAYLAVDNTYLHYAPDYSKTITHYRFDNLLEATYKGEDISTVERVYRWIAGFYMSKDHPLTGFGPGNFVNFYKSYTVTSFQTYVSDNPEGSGIHSYYLMTMVEQGYIGLIVFLVLALFLLIRGEQIYHRTGDPERRRVILMAILSMVVIDLLLIINDMLETDKVGPFFLICMALLTNWDIKEQPDEKGVQAITS